LVDAVIDPCVHTPLPWNSCTDGDSCNGDEICNADGLCEPGVELNCNDGNVCTADSCDSDLGCENDPVSLGDTTCGLGICQRTIDNCVDGESQVCTPGAGEPAEICKNGLDDDCNGLVDDGCGELAGCITDNTPPTTADDSANNLNGQPIEIPVLENDSDADGPNPLVIQSVTALDGGSAAISPDKKSIIYTPDPNASLNNIEFNHILYQVFDGDSCNGVVTGNAEVRNLGVAGGFCSLVRQEKTGNPNGMLPIWMGIVSMTSGIFTAARLRVGALRRRRLRVF
jgi:Big-like domain-containing protein